MFETFSQCFEYELAKIEIAIPSIEDIFTHACIRTCKEIFLYKRVFHDGSVTDTIVGSPAELMYNHLHNPIKAESVTEINHKGFLKNHSTDSSNV